MFPPQFTPAELIRIREPFDSLEYIFELKADGFRALAEVNAGQVRLISRRGNPYRSFGRLCEAIGSELRCEAILDGEVVCLDAEGRPQFYELLRRRGRPVFYAFDLLALDGEGWFKIRNPAYSQYKGRSELFERTRAGGA